ncbi:MAG: efflux RND transporter permease subunit, partial [Gammaproteobacteria bacterium]|nr:efflux RND transporter permease subunit [Gammaproteobacteria bacterium]
QGYSAMEAAKKGASEVSMAITASTLTTVAVFFPLVFIDGIAGQLFKDQALTVTYALLASLVVALTLIPAMAAHERNFNGEVVAGEAEPKVRPQRWYQWVLWVLKLPFAGLSYLLSMLISLLTLIWRTLALVFGFIFQPLLKLVQVGLAKLERSYRWLLQQALQAKGLVLVLTLAMTGLCFSLAPRLGFDVIPAMSQGEFYVEVQLPVGSAIERTDVVLKQLAQVAKQQDIVERTYAQAGTGQQMTVDPSIGGSHWGRLNIVLKPAAAAADEQQLMQLLRDTVAAMPDVTAKIDTPELFNLSTPMEIEVAGHELAALKSASADLANKLEALDRFADVKSSLRDGQPEISLHFDHQRLAQLEMTASDVAKRVANYVGGEVAGQFSIADRKVDIRVRLAEQYRNSEQELAQIIINPQSALPLPLSAVATISREIGPSEITRIGQQRVAVISANLAFGDVEQAAAEVRQLLSKTVLPYGVTVRLVGQSEEMERSFNSLVIALSLAVFLVYLVMASQFENLLQPLLILFTVPLAGAGAVLGLWLTGTRVSVIVFIGLIMLAGIVVNNAIVLIDRINQLREEGKAVDDAIVEACATRLRPVLMTTLTTVLGLMPMMFGGDGAEIRAPMAITVIFGLSCSTLLTLLFIPVIYRMTTRNTLSNRADTRTDKSDEHSNNTTVVQE